ncbi:MAG: PAS domain S-box protein, partial [Anaerolineae bacterium]
RLRGLADGRRVALVRNLGEYGPVDETPHPYTLLAQHSRDIILIVSYNNGRIVEANASAIDIYGYSREELLSLSIQDLRAPETHALTTVQMAQAHTQGLLFETLHRRKDGRTFPVEVNSKGTILNGASVLISIIRDISERRQVEETLQQRETKYHQLFSEMSSAGALHEIICDSAGRPVDYITLEVNHAFEVLLNTKSEEVIGKKASEILPPAELHHWLEICGPVALTGQSTPYEMYSLFNQKYFEGNAYCPEKGKFAVTFTDITKRKQMEAEHQAHLRFFAAMDRVNRAIQGTNDLEQMMSDVLDVVLSIFDCDRAFLLYPCDPAAARWRVPMECTKPEYPGVLAMGLEIPMTPNVAETFRILLAADGPVKFGSGTPYPLPADVSERFGFKSFMAMTLYPKLGQPWRLGCIVSLRPHLDRRRGAAFPEWRLADALTSLLQYRTLRDGERR